MWFNSIKHCLSNVGKFQGRDRRGQFWPYAATILLMDLVIWSTSVSVAINRINAGAHAADRVAASPSDGTDFFSILMVVMAAIGTATVMLLASAIVRRLHDRGSSGWWGVLPVPFLVISFIGTAVLRATAAEHSAGLMSLLLLNNVAYCASLISLIIMLAWPSETVENRFGSPNKGSGSTGMGG